MLIYANTNASNMVSFGGTRRAAQLKLLNFLFSQNEYKQAKSKTISACSTLK